MLRASLGDGVAGGNRITVDAVTLIDLPLIFAQWLTMCACVSVVSAIYIHKQRMVHESDGM